MRSETEIQRSVGRARLRRGIAALTLAVGCNPDTGGTTCKQDACTREQALRDCMLDIPVVCGALKQPFTMKYR